jgi:hypothetical protein
MVTDPRTAARCVRARLKSHEFSPLEMSLRGAQSRDDTVFPRQSSFPVRLRRLLSRSLIAKVLASQKCFLFGSNCRFSSRPTHIIRAARRLGQDGPQAPAQRRVAVCVLGMPSSLGVKVPCAT